MTTTLSDNHFSKLYKVSRLVLATAFVAMLITAIHPSLRSEARSVLLKDFRVVVSTANGDLLGDGSEITVAKIKTRESLLLEIYHLQPNGVQQLLERIQMPHKKDGYFTFNGQATNLVIEDVDGDGRPEILAPGFDHNHIGHLNIYRYNRGSNEFQRALL